MMLEKLKNAVVTQKIDILGLKFDFWALWPSPNPSLYPAAAAIAVAHHAGRLACAVAGCTHVGGLKRARPTRLLGWLRR